MKSLYPVSIFVLAAFGATYAKAQTVPPGEWNVGQQPIVYATIPASGIYTDATCTVSTCGVPTAFALQPANIPSVITDQVVAGGNTSGDVEGKWRGTFFGVRIALDDPLRNFCQPGASHPHEFLGPRDVGACSTYTQLRQACLERKAAGQWASTNPGDDVNCTPYWHPALIDRNPLGDGVDRFKKVYAVPLYYNTATNDPVETARFVDFPLGLGYVSGQNMDDPFRLQQKAAIAAANAANAANGTGARYQILDNTTPKWSCGGGDDTQYDNIDDVTCPAGGTLIMSMVGSACWDGKNLTSGDGPWGRGYGHVIPVISVSAANGTFQDVCPVNWWHVPGITNKPQFLLHTAISGSVPNDSPYLSSDAMFQATARAQAGQPGAPADAATFVCKPGCSAHFDYGPIAWDKKYLRRLFRKCLGIPWTDTSETDLDADQTTYITECIDPTLSTTANGGTATQLKISHQRRFPDVNGDRLQEYYPAPVPIGHMGPHTMPGQ